MKKINLIALAVLLFAIFANNVSAQTGVAINNSGAAASNCAILDVNTSNATLGMLIPRVKLATGTTTYGLSGTAAHRLLVYNNTTVSNGSLSLYPGFYFWDTIPATALWVPFVTGGNTANSGWLLQGNYGTVTSAAPTTYGATAINTQTPAANWFGTADSKDIVIGTGGIERMRIGGGATATAGNIGIGIAAPTSLLHVYDGTNSFGGSGEYLVTIDGSHTTAGSTMYIPSTSLTTGNLLYLNATNASATGNALLVNNSGTGGNGIQCTGGGALNYSSIYATTAAAAAGTNPAVTTSTHAIYASMTGGEPYSFALYGQVLVTATYSAGTMGYFSPSDYGMTGFWDGNYRYGVYGYGSNYGVYGLLRSSATPTSVSFYAGPGKTYDGVLGEASSAPITASGDYYYFGVHGSYSDSSSSYSGLMSGGVLGSGQAHSGLKSWAALGYETSGGTWYATYYDGTASGASGGGYLPDAAITGIGSGGCGGIIGSWTKGEVMGQVSAGELFASYNLGNAYTSGYSAEVVTLDDKRVAAYTLTSTDIKVYNDGTGTLTNGRASVNFDENFSELIGENIPVVTVTPMGQCNGVYITNVTSKGFDIIELNNGNSNVEFSYIVVGKRIDAGGKPELPDALKKKDFDENMKGVMHNENNTEQSGKPVWWDGTQIRFDAPPSDKTNKQEDKK